ncbi:MAG: hypothetical protein A2Y12_10225 [Planctomycetes bacterium GWF2_42_9]|nr:MAG: hypothetical protein A2Y12_10225 [Planctomycetes bacterium GWF2_42_9]
MKRDAFTVLEILVTITIIAILIAVIMPSFHYARQQSRMIVCSSNLRQNYLLLSSYSNDFYGFWPKTDSPAHTNQFYNINSQSANAPLFYLWKSGFAYQPKTWYCPAGKDTFDENWSVNAGTLQPNKNSAVSSYQYRMYFAYNWPDVKTAAARKRQTPQLIGYIKPSNYRNLAILIDTFNYSNAGTMINHQKLKSINVLFNDSAVIKRFENKKLQNMDLSWSQAGDWRIPLPNGSADTKHNLALLWRFLDTGDWKW